ncbi:MAG: glycosyltransferase family 2 protein [Candidatus Aenigmatarchaeota archaeon]
MGQQPFVSIILVNYNGEKFLTDCLDSLERTDYQKDMYEVILVDNASKDNSVKLIKEDFPWVKLIVSDRNTGYSEGNNMGVENATGKYLVFLNTDTIVEKNWLSELVKKIENDKSIGACSSQVLYQDDKNLINTIGGFWSVLGVPGSMGEKNPKDSFENETPTFSPTGCSMIIRSDLYKEVGGFDNDYFLYCEDADLGWRLWNRKLKIVLAPSSIVYHKVSASLKGLGKKTFSEWYYFYSARNRFITIMKNARVSDLLWMIPLYFVSHITLAVLFGLNGKFTAMKSTLKGMLYTLRDYSWLEKRRGYKKTGYANIRMIGIVETFRTFVSKKEKHF